jgi:hypothetical protein
MGRLTVDFSELQKVAMLSLFILFCAIMNGCLFWPPVPHSNNWHISLFFSASSVRSFYFLWPDPEFRHQTVRHFADSGQDFGCLIQYATHANISSSTAAAMHQHFVNKMATHAFCARVWWCRLYVAIYTFLCHMQFHAPVSTFHSQWLEAGAKLKTE